MAYVFSEAAAFNQQLSFNTAKVTTVRDIWQESDRNEIPDSDVLFSFQLQMYAMFFDAEAFNQPLYFDTAKVKTVRVYLYGVMQ